MTKGEYPYPPDEFDAVDPSPGPRGIHRGPRSTWSRVWPFLVALALSGALAFAVVGYLWEERGPTPTAQVTDVAPAPSEPEPSEPEPSDPATTEPSPAEPSPTPTPAPEPTVEAPPPPAPEPDLTTVVNVFNSTSIQGLAADAADQLEDVGWTEVDTGNYAGGTLAASTVFYPTPELEVSARAVADALGIATVQLAESDAGDGIDVVLERDFAG